MSSSDERQRRWDAFQPRAEPLDVELLSPAAELGAALQRYRADLDAERQRAGDAVAESLSIAVEQAGLIFRLEVVLARSAPALSQAGLDGIYRQLRVLKDQLLDALAQAGLTVTDPLGRSFEEVGNQVEVVGWRHGPDFAGEVVAETLEAIVLHRGTVIRQGQVIMGAPAHVPDTNPDGSSSEG